MKITTLRLTLLFLTLTLLLPLRAQTDADRDNGVVSLAGRTALVMRSADGSFVFKPYLMVLTTASFNYYDDQGLDKAYNQDNVANSGFAVPYSIIGFTGKAFNRLNYNVSVNAAASGHEILQQAWVDVQCCPKGRLNVRVGKFKTPFSHACLTTLGETLLPILPYSLTSAVLLPYTLNAVNPKMATGFDLGVEVHGFLANKFGYEVGLFNGTGSAVNTATKTFSDDWHIPSLLYAARLTCQPWGAMPASQGHPDLLGLKRMLFGVSASLNVESESESTNDFRLGAEVALLCKRLYVGAEAYWMNVGFTRRMKVSDDYNYLGGYLQAGYFVGKRVQVAARYDFLDRNGLDCGGFLNMPSVGVNWFVPGCGLKLQAQYIYCGRWGHDTQLDRDNDLLSMPTHSAKVALQYCF